MVVVGVELKILCDRRQNCKLVAGKGIFTVVTSSSPPENMSRGDPPSPPPVPPPSPSRRRFR
jgi:hypothetical protein